MKKYVKPSFKCVELRTEERLAICYLYANAENEADCPPQYIVEFTNS
jgi:hypothetical protein